MTLDTLLEREPAVNRFIARVNEIDTKEDEELIKRKDKINEYLEKISSWLIQDRASFNSYLNILNARLDIRDRNTATEFWSRDDDKYSLKELAAFMVRTQKNQYRFDDPDFQIMLKAVEKGTVDQAHSYHPDFETMQCPMPNLLFQGTNILKELRTKLPERQVKSLAKYVINSAGNSPCDIWHNMEDFPEMVDAAIKQGFTKELYLMIDVLGYLDSAYIGKHISTGMGIKELPGMEDNFLSLCRKLKLRNKPKYFSEIARRVKRVVRYNPSNAHVLTDFAITTIVDNYATKGIEKRLFEVLDFAVNTHKKRKEKVYKRDGLGHKKIQMDNCMDFWVNFPVIYYTFGDKSFDIFSKIYNRLENRINAMSILEGAMNFYQRKLDERIDFDQWLDHVLNNIQEANVYPEFIKGTMDAVEAGIDLNYTF